MLLDDRHESPALLIFISNATRGSSGGLFMYYDKHQMGVELTYLDVKSRKICITAVKGTMRRARLRFTKDLCL